MTKCRRTRPMTPQRLRRFALLSLSLAALAGAGCQRFPLRYADVTPPSNPNSKTRVETTSPDDPQDSSSTPHASIKVPVIDHDPANILSKNSPTTSTITTPLASNHAEPVEPSPVEPPQEPAFAPAENAETKSPTALIDKAISRAGSILIEPADAKMEPPAELKDLADSPKPTPIKEDPKPAEPLLVEAPSPSKITAEKEPSASLIVASPKNDEPLVPAAVIPDPPLVPATPKDDWKDPLEQLRLTARRRAGEPGEASEAWAIRSRVIDWLAGDGTGPVAEQNQSWNQILAALSTATSPETTDPSLVSHNVDVAVDTIETLAPLRINDLHLCKKIDGFAHYEPLQASLSRVGQPLLIYCEMTGLRYEETKDQLRSRISSRVELVPAGGGPPAWSQALGTAEDLCRRRRRDYYVNYRLVIPSDLPPQAYSLRLTQTDEISGRSTSSEVALILAP